jgi:putative oxidoreductase
MAFLSRLSRYHHTGLLLLRIGIGVMMIFHGYPKLKGGPGAWGKIGGSLADFGIHDFPAFWGFMAAFAEGVGGLLFLIGFFFRPASLLLLITMVVAAGHHLNAGDGIGGASHAIELGVLFLAMFIIGPGKYSIDKG